MGGEDLSSMTVACNPLRVYIGMVYIGMMSHIVHQSIEVSIDMLAGPAVFANGAVYSYMVVMYCIRVTSKVVDPNVGIPFTVVVIPGHHSCNSIKCRRRRVLFRCQGHFRDRHCCSLGGVPL
jgi:hypothetical protein